MSNIKSLSLANKIPIIEEDALNFIKRLIKTKKLNKILEVGTAYGYSASEFSFSGANTHVDTIEKNQTNYQVAKQNLKPYKNIKVLNYDVLDFKLYQKELTFQTYDLIFLDGPKKSVKIQFDYFINLLSKKGILIVDNVFLKNLKKQESLKNKKSKIILAMDDFVNKTLKNLAFNSKIKDIGDGLLIVSKRED